MKFLSKSCLVFRKNVYVKGDEKLNAFTKQLSQSFLKNPPSLCNTQDEINDSLFDIYQLNFSDAHSNLWTNFNLEISLEKVVKYINELKDNKDPGPMKISARFLKYNVAIVAPIIRNAYGHPYG